MHWRQAWRISSNHHMTLVFRSGCDDYLNSWFQCSQPKPLLCLFYCPTPSLTFHVTIHSKCPSKTCLHRYCLIFVNIWSLRSGVHSESLATKYMAVHWKPMQRATSKLCHFFSPVKALTIWRVLQQVKPYEARFEKSRSSQTCLRGGPKGIMNVSQVRDCRYGNREGCWE
jgi:hypothetical protein